MSCDCKSYNKQTGTVEEVVLPRPDWMPEGQRVNGIPVDACIAEVVRYLWSKGVVTLGSCCGHNKNPPSLILEQTHRNYAEIRQYLAQVDTRSWELLQWRLMNTDDLLR